MKPGALAKYTTKGGFLSREKAASEPLKDQFIWIARFKANPGKRDEFMQAVLTHTANVQRTEDGTLSFVALESPEDDVSIALFERYTSKKYFDEVHFTSGSMKEFREKVNFSILKAFTTIADTMMPDWSFDGRKEECRIPSRGRVHRQEGSAGLI